MHAFQAVLTLLILVPFAQSLPVDHAPSSRASSHRSPPEPGTLLGRRYSLNRGPPVAANSDTSGQPSPHYRAVSRRRPTPFPKYLAERAVASRGQASRGAGVDYVSYVGAHPGNEAEASKSSPAVQPTASPYLDYNTSITLIPRPTDVVHAKHSDVASKHVKNASTKTVTHTA